MTIRTLQSAAIAAVLFCISGPAWSQQYLLYEPRPVTSGQPVTPEEGILVQEIEVKKGDTMYGLSRKFTGRGMYYPQILLFNVIKNPNLIYPGNILKIPVSHKSLPISKRHAGSVHEASSRDATTVSGRLPARVESDVKEQSPAVVETPTETGKSRVLAVPDVKSSKAEKNRAVRGKGSVDAGKNAQVPVKLGSLPSSRKKGASPVSKGDAVKSQELFEQAVKAYRQDDCRTALELFDRYLVSNSDSPLAADANLYKAECYMKLSTQ
jgi:LysM repeat protein